MTISGVNGTGQRRPTMKEVAARAGVALKTVSRVVNEEPNVSPELTAKVQAAIKELNYTPNESARMLRRGKTGTIAVVIRDIGDPFFASLGRAVELWARSSGSVVMIGLTDEDPEREREVCLEFVARRPDALIMAPIGETQDYLAPHVDAGMAVVTIDRPAHGIEADAVLADNAGGIDQAIDHLVRQGHRRIAYLGDDERIFTARERVVAYRAAMARHRIDVDEDLVHLSEPTTEGIGITLSAVLDRPEPATALLSANNMTTAEVLRGLAGRRDRVALVSFDDLALGDLLSPGLTAVAQSADVMARTAIQLMTERLPEPHRPGRTVRVPVKLTIRGSGEIPPAAEPQLRRQRALERVAGVQADVVQVVDDDLVRREQADLGVVHAVQGAVLADDRLDLPERRPGHAREQVVLDLVVQAAHREVDQDAAADVA